MTYTYRLLPEHPDQQMRSVLRIEDNVGIPFDPANTDYQEFLRSGAVAAPYVAPPEPTPLTTEQKIAAAGFNEGELEDFLVAKIQTRLNG